MKVVSLLKERETRNFLLFLAVLACALVAPNVYAEDPGNIVAPGTFAQIASNVIEVFTIMTKAIAGAAYVAGVGFAVGAIMKFKQHKDNPTQIPIGTPIALLFIAVALVALPAIIEYTGTTLFGAGAKVGQPKGEGIIDIFKKGNQ